ncbi:TadE/TadG family type IV pilus assembly protein [Microbispora sp. NPDC049633]|uniref:TadE/TadG family type IV pilus assembly protein n=1 Tax=Microbispora sp. NPDC049633 TaxID=3154355 RepID=UPI003418EFA1
MTNARAADPVRCAERVVAVVGTAVVGTGAVGHGAPAGATADAARVPNGSRPRRAGASTRAGVSERLAGNARAGASGRGERGGRASGRRKGERGATVIELAMLMPVVLAVVLLIVQVTLWFHGRQVADAAAREGARVARAGGSDGWQEAAEGKARQIVQAIGPQLLKNAQAKAWEQGDQRGVEITGSAVQVVPLLPETTFTITSRFGGPIECFRPDDGSDGCE